MRLTDDQKAEISSHVTEALKAGHDLGDAVLLGAFVLGAEILDDEGKSRFVSLHFNGSDAHLLGIASVMVAHLQPVFDDDEDD